MATASATLSPATFTAASTITSPNKKKKMSANVVQNITGLNSFGGLKAQNRLTSLGQPITTQQSFANLVMSMRGKKNRGGGGGGLSSTCSVAGEIFQIAAIMNGLTLVGVAVGFVLLRIEAFVEEGEAEA